MNSRPRSAGMMPPPTADTKITQVRASFDEALRKALSFLSTRITPENVEWRLATPHMKREGKVYGNPVTIEGFLAYGVAPDRHICLLIAHLKWYNDELSPKRITDYDGWVARAYDKPLAKDVNSFLETTLHNLVQGQGPFPLQWDGTLQLLDTGTKLAEHPLPFVGKPERVGWITIHLPRTSSTGTTMSAPTTIKYQGQVYKLAGTHKKCPKGTHWNREQRKCLPLPKGLQRRIERATRASAKADAATVAAKGSKKAGPHLRAEKAHDRAMGQHHVAAQHAERLGFRALERRHYQAHDRHLERSIHHEHRAEDKPL